MKVYEGRGITISGFVSGNVTLNGGNGNVEEVEISSGSYIANPDITGLYLLELPSGTYDITASLEGYILQTVLGVIVENGQTTYDIDFELEALSEADPNIIPTGNIMLSNYPNPFNPTTTISFLVTQTSSFVNLEIFNLKGQKIKQLVGNQLSAGQHSVIWDGTDESEKEVGSGIYFYQLKTNHGIIQKKMLLIK